MRWLCLGRIVVRKISRHPGFFQFHQSHHNLAWTGIASRAAGLTLDSRRLTIRIVSKKVFNRSKSPISSPGIDVRVPRTRSRMIGSEQDLTVKL